MTDETPTPECPTCGRDLPADAPAGLCPYCLLMPAETLTSAVGFTPPDPEELQQHFNGVEVQELLGRGGMGAVYLARQTHLDRPVALKILPPETAAEPGFESRFTREARTLAKLSHPGIVNVFDFGQAGPYAFLVMEYVDGLNLREVMAGRAEKRSPEEAMRIVPQLCEALQYAHDRGVVHRDIKPENILLADDGRVKIADFGLARAVSTGETRLTATRQVVGTPHYMAPEQFERPREVDHRADIFALGVVFYELLTGELPLGRFAPPSEFGGTPPGVDRVVLKSLEKEPSKRYDSATGVKQDLESPPPEEPETKRETAERWGRAAARTAVAYAGGVRKELTRQDASAVVGLLAVLTYLSAAALLSLMAAAPNGDEAAVMFALAVFLTPAFALWTFVKAVRSTASPGFSRPAVAVGKRIGRWLAVGPEGLRPLGGLAGLFGEPRRPAELFAAVAALCTVAAAAGYLVGEAFWSVRDADLLAAPALLGWPFVYFAWAWRDRVGRTLGLAEGNGDLADLPPHSLAGDRTFRPFRFRGGWLVTSFLLVAVTLAMLPLTALACKTPFERITGYPIRSDAWEELKNDPPETVRRQAGFAFAMLFGNAVLGAGAVAAGGLSVRRESAEDASRSAETNRWAAAAFFAAPLAAALPTLLGLLLEAESPVANVPLACGFALLAATSLAAVAAFTSRRPNGRRSGLWMASAAMAVPTAVWLAYGMYLLADRSVVPLSAQTPDEALGRFVLVVGVTLLCGVLAAGAGTYAGWRVLRGGAT